MRYRRTRCTQVRSLLFSLAILAREVLSEPSSFLEFATSNQPSKRSERITNKVEVEAVSMSREPTIDLLIKDIAKHHIEQASPHMVKEDA